MSSKSSYSVLSKDGFNSRVSSLKDSLKEAKKNVENLHVHFSDGNTKVGCIPSVSTLPVVDCVNCKACKASCYDLRHDLIYKTVKNSRAINSAIYAADPERYFREIDAWITLHYPRAFRWHIGGDIKGQNTLLVWYGLQSVTQMSSSSPLPRRLTLSTSGLMTGIPFLPISI